MGERAYQERNGKRGKGMKTKKCPNCGKITPYARWRLTMDFNGVWTCTCPECKQKTEGL
jgi:hypothetical protein